MERRTEKNQRTGMILTVAGFLLLPFTACEEFVTVPNPGLGIISDNIFRDDATAISAVSAIYGPLSSDGTFTNGELSILEGLYTDELVSFVPNSTDTYVNNFFQNTIFPTNGFLSSTWGLCYSSIFSSNLVIEGLQKPNGVSVMMQKQLKGEALFLRAFCHLYLTNLFGDVPLIKTSDYRINARISRSPATQVYEGIIDDLLEAKELLTDEYPSAGRVRANRGVATALLARAYLYAGRFADAESQATEVINKPSQYSLSADLNQVFLKTSTEAVWQLFPKGDLYTYEGYRFIVMAAPPQYVTLRNDLYNAFEPGDLRKTYWTNSITSESGLSTWYYAYKYKQNSVNGTGAEYSTVLRLAEQYLIRAEARAQLNELTGDDSAEADINIIRARAGLPATTAATKDELMDAILHERRVELFTEWGHRFFDLRRMKKLDEVMSSVKNSWNSNYALLPIPQSEILLNANLKPQNPGY